MLKCALLMTLSLGTLAFAGVTVSSPQNNATVGTEVQFVATATSSCSNGVSAMGIYTSPGVLVYTENGDKLSTDLNLSPGTYNTVVQEWDNCGESTKTPITITVGDAHGANVEVSAPTPNSTVNPTVQFVASASTSCAKGVASMGIYTAPGVLAYVVPGAKLDTTLELKPGSYGTVVQEWDNCGGASTAKVPITVAGTTSGGTGTSGGGTSGGGTSGGGTSGAPSGAGVFSNLQQQSGWTGYGLLPADNYNICSGCKPSGPQVTWSMGQNVASPSMTGHSSLMQIGGDTDYADVLWNNHLIGDFSSRGMPDYNKTIVPSLHNFTYDVYFFVQNPAVSQALEFDINQFEGGYSFIWGHECRIAGGHEWDIWDNPSQSWHPTGIPCNPIANAWNHLIIQVERTSDNHLLFKSITLNGVTSTLNYYEDPTKTSWYGVTVNYQQDGNYKQTPYPVWLDKLTFTYW